MFSFLATLVKPITAIAGPIVSGWQARKSAELEGDLAVTKALTQAKITHVETAQAGNIDWDAMAMKNSAQSWKDEFWTIVLSIPMIMAFVPGFVPFIMAGFAALSAMPIWYQGALSISIEASFGYRKFADWKYNLK